MVDLCCKEFDGLDLQLNSSKSACMRIGPRWHKTCSPIITKTGVINWVTETTYLGVTIVAGRNSIYLLTAVNRIFIQASMRYMVN